MTQLIRFICTLVIAVLLVISGGFLMKVYPHSFTDTTNNPAINLSSNTSESAVDRDLAIAYRRQYMKALSAHYRSLEAILEKNAPFANQTLTHINSLLSLAEYMPEVFPPGTAMTHAEGWGAKPLIWSEPDNFSRLIANFQTSLETLKTVVNNQQNPINAIESFTQVRQTCLDCHSTYRVRQP
ncbi:MAG: cytochrome c [Arthrospira sp. PLM2.Bin9]|nr:cytochrome c [Arthrospira sp. PLM2.Bin9]TVU53466.1 MAG: cytochrome c [Arthrospira sp. PLM2.Bin9]